MYAIEKVGKKKCRVIEIKPDNSDYINSQIKASKSLSDVIVYHQTVVTVGTGNQEYDECVRLKLLGSKVRPADPEAAKKRVHELFMLHAT